ncbi:MAG: relaxase/mobilization nuclease domain protein [Nevskia sp.]|nr:relaxase/mobilization nuclease domain protein [Nevskia sp.]
MTDDRDDELLRDQPLGRKGKTGRLLGPGLRQYRHPDGGQAKLARSLRIAQRHPQAVLKITRYGHGGHKILAHVRYVARHGKLSLEDENGEQIEDVRELRRRVQLWTAQAGATMEEPNAEITRKRRVTAHFILDAGPDADRAVLSKSVQEFMAERFGKKGHEYLFARHDDTRQPHVHVVLSMMDGQGRRLHTNVAEVQRWREQFAEIARGNGIEVDASRAWERGKAPTRSRGLVKYGAPRPTRWTREQVRRGLAARKERLLSDAALASARGDSKRAQALNQKAAGLRMRTDDKLVRHTVAERRGAAAKMPWEVARATNAQRIVADFQGQATQLEEAAQRVQDDTRRTQLSGAAKRLREFAKDVQATPTRAQKIAQKIQQRRSSSIDRDAADLERD